MPTRSRALEYVSRKTAIQNNIPYDRFLGSNFANEDYERTTVENFLDSEPRFLLTSRERDIPNF